MFVDLTVKDLFLVLSNGNGHEKCSEHRHLFRSFEIILFDIFTKNTLILSEFSLVITLFLYALSGCCSMKH